MNNTKKACRRLILLFGLLGPVFGTGTRIPAQAGPGDKGVSDTPERPRIDRFGDPLPPGAIHRFGTTRFRPAGKFGPFSQPISPDGELMAFLTHEGCSLFDLTFGKERRLCLYPPGMVVDSSSYVGFSPDGKSVATISQPGGECLIWDPATGRLVRRLYGFQKRVDEVIGKTTEPFSKEMEVRGLGFTEDGKSLLAWVGKMKVCVLDVVHDKLSREFDLEGGPVVSVSKDRNWLLVGTTRREFQLVDSSTGKVKSKFRVPADWKPPDRTPVPALGADKFDIFPFHPEDLTAAVVSPMGNQVLMLTGTRIRTFEATGKLIHAWEVKASRLGNPSDLDPIKLAITPDDKILFVPSMKGQILRFELANGKELPPLDGVGRHVQLEFHPDGKTLISREFMGPIRRWNRKTGLEQSGEKAYELILESHFTANGSDVIVNDSSRGRVDVWDVATGQRLHLIRTNENRPATVAVGGDGRSAVVATTDGRLSIRDLPTWKENCSIQLKVDHNPAGFAYFSTATISPDGKRLLVSARGWGTGLFDLATRKQLWRQDKDADEYHRVCVFAADGSTFFAADLEMVSCFETETGKLKWVCPYSKDKERLFRGGGMDASADGRLVAVALQDETILLIDSATGRVAKCLDDKDGASGRSVSFSPDGKWLLCPGSDCNPRILDVASGVELFRFKGNDPTLQAQFHPDGKRALTVQWISSVLLWDLHPPHTPVAKADPERIWNDLASRNGPTAYRAIWSLIDDPVTAVELLKHQLKPIPPSPGRDVLMKLISQLHDDDFATREQASEQLIAQGPGFLPLLQEVQQKSQIPEQRRRLTEIRDAIHREPSTPEEWRILRAVQALELGASDEGRSLLKSWMTGRKGALLTEQAREAVARMSK